MSSDPKQGQVASLIISIIILIIVCANWYNTNNQTQTTSIKNPQRIALGTYVYNQNRNNFNNKRHITKTAEQILNNITNTYNGGSRSNWANWIQGGQAKTAAKNIYGAQLNNNYEKNNGNLAKADINDKLNYFTDHHTNNTMWQKNHENLARNDINNALMHFTNNNFA
jgi:hypothetical protein